MLRVALSIFLCAFTFNTLADTGHSRLVKRCNKLIELLNEVERAQHKAICRSKVASAMFKIDLAATKIPLKRYKDAEHHINFALEDISFGIMVDCTLKHDWVKAKREGHKIKEEISNLRNK